MHYQHDIFSADNECFNMLVDSEIHCLEVCISIYSEYYSIFIYIIVSIYIL